MQENGSITGFPGAQAYEGENLLFEEVDILIPAAIEHAIDMSNVDKIKAKVCSDFPPSDWFVILMVDPHPLLTNGRQVCNQVEIKIIRIITLTILCVFTAYVIFNCHPRHCR